MKGRWKWKQRGWPRVVVRERMDEELERSRESWELTLTVGEATRVAGSSWNKPQHLAAAMAASFQQARAELGRPAAAKAMASSVQQVEATW